MMFWRALFAGVALLTVEDVSAGIPKQATNTVPSVEPTGSGASTPVPKRNPSTGPTDVPTPLSNLNPSSAPLGTGAPTPVLTGSKRTDVPTPLSNLNPFSGPLGTGAPTPVATGSKRTDGLDGTGAPSPMTRINPLAGSTPANGPTLKSSFKTSAGVSAEPSTGTPSRVTDVTPFSGHTGTETKTSVSIQSLRPTPKSTIAKVKTSTETMTVPSHIPLIGSSLQSTDHSPITGVRPSTTLQSPTSRSSMMSATKTTSVTPSIAAQFPTGGSSTVSTTKVTVKTSTTRKQPTSEDVHVSTTAPTSATSPTTQMMHSTTPQTTKSQLTNKPVQARENKTECFEYLGCFDNFPPFDNAGLDLPYSPDVINTKFWLFTRNNLKNKHVLDYRNISTFTSFDFDATKPTKFITHGFSQDATATWVVEMKNEFLRLGDFNVITVDWKKGAEFPDYDQAVANTRLVATQIRVVVDILVHRGLKLQDLHLTGHSLGAHTSGYAGFLMKGKVGRISGLDPAEPNFENLPDVVRLDKADALFVDVIHTNGESVLLGGFGLMEPSGHVDFFVNGGKSQPGCKGAISGALSSIFGKGGPIGKEVACSHGRSHQLYQESMSTPCPFTSYPCPSYDDFKKGKCLTCGSTGCSQLGYYADQYYARGKMYLNTGSKAPYCGYHYGVEIKTSSTKDTKGRLYVKLGGIWGVSDFLPVTGDDAVKAGSEVQDVIVSPVEVGDLKSLVFKYVKHTGFWLGGGEDTLKVERVKVTSGENGESYLFCYGGKEVQHNTEARSTITSRTNC